MTQIIAIALAVLGAILSTGVAGSILFQEAIVSGASIFPMPLLILVDWSILGLAGAVYIILSELRSDDRQLQGAWGMIGAFLPLIVLGAFSLALYGMISAALLLAPTILLTIRRRLSFSGYLGSLSLGALANLVVLFAIIGLNVLI